MEMPPGQETRHEDGEAGLEARPEPSPDPQPVGTAMSPSRTSGWHRVSKPGWGQPLSSPPAQCSQFVPSQPFWGQTGPCWAGTCSGLKGIFITIPTIITITITPGVLQGQTGGHWDCPQGTEVTSTPRGPSGEGVQPPHPPSRPCRRWIPPSLGRAGSLPSPRPAKGSAPAGTRCQRGGRGATPIPAFPAVSYPKSAIPTDPGPAGVPSPPQPCPLGGILWLENPGSCRKAPSSGGTRGHRAQGSVCAGHTRALPHVRVLGHTEYTGHTGTHRNTHRTHRN